MNWWSFVAGMATMVVIGTTLQIIGRRLQRNSPANLVRRVGSRH